MPLGNREGEEAGRPGSGEREDESFLSGFLEDEPLARQGKDWHRRLSSPRLPRSVQTQ